MEDAFVSKLVDVLFSFAKEEAAMVLGVQDEIGRLLRRLERIRHLLTDAARRRFRDESINMWVRELKDIVYDAEDIIDECRIQDEKRRASSSCVGGLVPRTLTLCSCFPRLRFRHEIAHRIKTLNLRLEEISHDKATLTLAPTPPDDRRESRTSRFTSPRVDPFIVGTQIESDTKTLVGLLASEHKQKLPIYAIVGMGGIGKTTLAQKICNDEKLLAYFDQPKPVWVCVSKEYSEIKILRDIIKGVVGRDPGETRDKSELDPLLSQVVTNKKLFLVLDDIWNASIWNDLLQSPLQSAGAGSRILVTTRDERVASGMRAVHNHTVKTLSDDDSWSLLCKMLFQDEEEDEIQNLEDIGRRIVEKCDRLPLAIKTVAGVLRTREKRQLEWENVLRNPAWLEWKNILQNLTWSMTERSEGGMGALYLSYEDLPPHLKQCFVSLSLFPEDTILLQPVVGIMWISEGFVEAKGDLTMEEVAVEYWKELVWRSLLHPDENYYDNDGCRMHDVMLSLAQYLARDEIYCGEVRRLKERFISSLLMEPRHLNIIDKDAKVISDILTEQTCLRTLIFQGLENISDSDFRKLRRLRVLNLNRSYTVELPDSIGNLIHLRCLDLYGSPIREVPKSIKKLRNLQFLILGECKELRDLPKGITSLKNLRTLHVEGTQLKAMPTGIGALTQLRDLSGFVVSSSSTLEELRPLSQLRFLSVNKLERASSREEAKAASIKNKPHLINLQLWCTPSDFDVESSVYSEEETIRITDVFSELCPPSGLVRLEIQGYFGLEYPSWIMKMSMSFLPNLRVLVLIDCNRCPRLPLLGLLPQLDYLWISGASAVVSIGTELFLPSSNASARKRGELNSYYSFPKLELLRFSNMPNWKEWRWLEEGEEKNQDMVLLPRLRRLELDGCPKLRSLPEALIHHAAKLKVVIIRGAHNLEVIKNLYTIPELYIYDNSNLQRVSNLLALKRLNLHCCSGLRDVERLNQLQYLELEDLEMESLPKWLLTESGELQFPLLQKLHFWGSTKLLSRCLVDGPDWPKIRDIPHVKGHVLDTSKYITKTPFTFDTNL